MLRGRQIFESSRSHDMRVAVALQRRRKAEIAEGRVVISHAEVPPFSQALQTYIAQIENPNTRKRYQLAADVLLQHMGDRPIDELTPFMFDKFKEVRIAAGVTPAGVNRELALARAVLNSAVERRLIPFSPFNGVKLFNEARCRNLPRTLSWQDEAQIMGCCDLRLRTLIILLLETAMRVGIEALRLRWSEVDFEEGTITVVQSKTVAGRRVIPMSAFCRETLLEWRAKTAGISEYVFFSPQNPTTHIRSVKTAWRNALKSAGIQSLPLYNCRHSAATRLAAAGVQDSTIDQLLGHARRDVLSFYIGRVPEHLRDAISKLEDLRRSKESASSAVAMKCPPRAISPKAPT